MSTALVTGAAGFIGSHLVDRLLAEEDCTVVGVDSLDPYYDPEHKRDNLAAARANGRFELVEADLIELATQGGAGPLEELLRGSDVVYHLAAQPGVRGSWGAGFDSYERNNVLATQRLLEASHAAAVPKLVYASSSSVYGDVDSLPTSESQVCRPYSPYGVTKLAAEHLCGLYARNHGLDVTALRFFTVYGPRQRPDMAFRRFMEAALRDEPLTIYGDGSQTRDFTYVDDIVDGLHLASGRGIDGVYNLGSGRPISMVDALSVLESITGMQTERASCAAQSGDVKDTWASIERAAKIGYSPQVGLEEGLTRQWEWLQGAR